MNWKLKNPSSSGLPSSSSTCLAILIASVKYIVVVLKRGCIVHTLKNMVPKELPNHPSNPDLKIIKLNTKHKCMTGLPVPDFYVDVAALNLQHSIAVSGY